MTLFLAPFKTAPPPCWEVEVTFPPLFVGYSGISVGKIIERKASDTRLGEDRVYRRRRGSWCGSWRKSESLARWL